MSFLVVLPLLYILYTGKIDFASPANLIRVRILFVLVMGALFAITGYIYWKIQQRKDGRKVRVPKGQAIAFNRTAQPAPGEGETPAPEPETEEMTVAHHDTQACIAFAKDLGQIAMMMGVIHLWMGVVPPLVFQSLLKPYAFFTSSLAKTYLYGLDNEETARPWVAPAAGPNFLAKLFGAGEQASPEEPTPPTPAAQRRVKSKKD